MIEIGKTERKDLEFQIYLYLGLLVFVTWGLRSVIFTWLVSPPDLRDAFRGATAMLLVGDACISLWQLSIQLRQLLRYKEDRVHQAKIGKRQMEITFSSGKTLTLDLDYKAFTLSLDE